MGTFAVQIAKSFGAEVTGVCSTTNVDTVHSIGADHVIDYTQQDFTQGGKRYDLIFGNVENRSLSDCRRALTPGGTLILNSGTGAQAGHRQKYPLHETPAALCYIEGGHARGTVVITL